MSCQKYRGKLILSIVQKQRRVELLGERMALLGDFLVLSIPFVCLQMDLSVGRDLNHRYTAYA